jgi:hypothetical protein
MTKPIPLFILPHNLLLHVSIFSLLYSPTFHLFIIFILYALKGILFLSIHNTCSHHYILNVINFSHCFYLQILPIVLVSNPQVNGLSIIYKNALLLSEPRNQLQLIWEELRLYKQKNMVMT